MPHSQVVELTLHLLLLGTMGPGTIIMIEDLHPETVAHNQGTMDLPAENSMVEHLAEVLLVHLETQ